MQLASADRRGKIRIYQLLVRLFGNSNPNPQVNGSKEENGCGTFDDLSNSALDSIKELGISHIWLTGILRHATQTDYRGLGMAAQHPAVVKGIAGSPYAITDFFELDPDLAHQPANRWESFQSCLARIQEAGMGTIIDFIPNHTARQYASAKGREVLGWDLGEKDNTASAFHPANNYYYLPGEPLRLEHNVKDFEGKEYAEFPAKATGNDAFTSTPSHFDWFETVKLNYGVDPQSGKGFFDPIPPTWLYMREVLRFWASKGVDGFRCDMVEMVPVAFWQWAIASIKDEFPTIFFIGEVYNPLLYRSFLDKAGFDFLYDKVEMYDTLRALVEEKGDANSLTSVWQKQEGFSYRMLRFLENHDEQRIASDLVGKDAARALPAMAVATLAHSGPVMLYFGQELGERAEGEAGFSGDDGKTSIFDYFSLPTLSSWNQNGKWDVSALPGPMRVLRNAYEIILKTSEQKVFSEGGFYDLQFVNHHNPHFNTSTSYAFLRYLPGDSWLIVTHFSHQNQVLRLVIPQDAWSLLGIDVDKVARLSDHFSGSSNISFFPSATYVSDGGTPGLVIPIQAWGCAIFRISNDRT